MLFLVATPIGNRGDLTRRAVEVLNDVDYILCEDTRRTRILLASYAIKARLKSYHRFSEAKQLAGILADLRAQKRLALVSDAGTPGISDPGETLVRECRLAGIPVIPIPGPSAIIAALSASGFPTCPFQFIGFLPKRPAELTRTLAKALSYAGTTICFEAPGRLRALLQRIAIMAPRRTLIVARELTKMHESFHEGAADALLDTPELSAPRGECVVLIAPPEKGALWQEWTPRQHVELLMEQYGLEKMDAVKLAAQMRSVPKREIYGQTL